MAKPGREGPITAVVSAVDEQAGVVTVTTQGEAPITWADVPVSGNMDIEANTLVLLEFADNGDLPVVTGTVPKSRIQKYHRGAADNVDPGDLREAASVGVDGLPEGTTETAPGGALGAILALKQATGSGVVSDGFRSLYGTQGAEARDIFVARVAEAAAAAGEDNLLAALNNAAYYLQTKGQNPVEPGEGRGTMQLEW